MLCSVVYNQDDDNGGDDDGCWCDRARLEALFVLIALAALCAGAALAFTLDWLFYRL